MLKRDLYNTYLHFGTGVAPSV